MYFDNLQQALLMDGHGVFVWAAYGITLLMLAVVLIAPWRRERRLLRELNGQMRRSQPRCAVTNDED